MKDRKNLYRGIAAAGAAGGTLFAMNAFAAKMTKALLYRHHKEEDRPSILESKYNGKNIYIKNEQGIQLRGILLEEQDAPATVLILHPFGLEAKDMSLYVPYFKEHLPQANILLIDACGHGQSDGYIRGLGIKDVNDLVCWNQYIIDTFGKDHKIVLFGKELGANTILNAAGKHVLKNVSAIISDGACTRPYDLLSYRMIKDYKVPQFPVMPLIYRKIKRAVKINIKEDTVALVKHNDIPTIYIHMREDDFVPLKMVYPLYNATRGSKVLFVLKDERYLYELEEDDEFKQTLAQFIQKYV